MALETGNLVLEFLDDFLLLLYDLQQQDYPFALLLLSDFRDVDAYFHRPYA